MRFHPSYGRVVIRRNDAGEGSNRASADIRWERDSDAMAWLAPMEVVDRRSVPKYASRRLINLERRAQFGRSTLDAS